MVARSTPPEVRVIKRWQLNPYLVLEASADAIELLTAPRDRSPDLDRRDGYREADAPDPYVYTDIMHQARAWKRGVHAPGQQYPPAERAAAYAALEDSRLWLPGDIPSWRVTAFLADYHSAGAPSMDVFVRAWGKAE